MMISLAPQKRKIIESILNNKRNNDFFIVGERGSGKTEISKLIAIELILKKQNVLFFVNNDIKRDFILAQINMLLKTENSYLEYLNVINLYSLISFKEIPKEVMKYFSPNFESISIQKEKNKNIFLYDSVFSYAMAIQENDSNNDFLHYEYKKSVNDLFDGNDYIFELYKKIKDSEGLFEYFSRFNYIIIDDLSSLKNNEKYFFQLIKKIFPLIKIIYVSSDFYESEFELKVFELTGNYKNSVFITNYIKNLTGNEIDIKNNLSGNVFYEKSINTTINKIKESDYPLTAIVCKDIEKVTYLKRKITDYEKKIESLFNKKYELNIFNIVQDLLVNKKTNEYVLLYFHFYSTINYMLSSFFSGFNKNINNLIIDLELVNSLFNKNKVIDFLKNIVSFENKTNKEKMYFWEELMLKILNSFDNDFKKNNLILKFLKQDQNDFYSFLNDFKNEYFKNDYSKIFILDIETIKNQNYKNIIIFNEDDFSIEEKEEIALSCLENLFFCKI